MKKNIFLLVSVVLFVGLFYQQGPGLNIGIFGLAAWLFLFSITPPTKRSREFLVLSAASITSAFSFIWYGDFISFAALFMSLLLTGFKSFYPRMSVLFFPLYLAFNYTTFIFRVLMPQKWLGITFSSDGLLKKVISYILIPGLLAGAFIIVYALASEKFASMFTVDLKFDFFQLVVLAAAGFFLVFNFFYSAVPRIFIVYNGYLKDDFSEGFALMKNRGFQLLDAASQRRSGEIALVLLNALLVFFIIIYCTEQFGSATVTGTLSAEVHEHVYVLILSIIMAIVVIMIYFQGLLNFDGRSAFLKKLSFVWIGLNTLLILTVFFRNLAYVNSYGLTFKRIGVFIFLLLSLAGLFVTWYKLKNRKTNAFLITRMAWSAYGVLVISCMVNWSWIVTKYNTGRFSVPDWVYLNSLDYNKQLLYDIYKANEMDTKEIKTQVAAGRSEKFLSKRLYYDFLSVE